ncbi:helix-turn-helix transcriptional regulator [Ilumatobacter sp.]|uniref:helix-turn-helix transcriptional regulator n=1 Tax=Ilumatobacter sp. TaxID=1967498 RepID=UPI003B5263BB
MADTAARTLRLLTLLQRRRYWPGPELASQLEISERTLRRDVERLRDLGYTVDSDRGVDGGYRLGAGTGATLLLLGDDEATALAAALHSAACGATELAEASLGALTKVLAMLGPDQRRRAETVRSTTAPTSSRHDDSPRLSVLDAVAAAARDRVRLGFDYVAADGSETTRYVEPCGLVALGTRWYLVAHDTDRGGWRTFRIDRIDAPVPGRNHFTPRPPPAADLAEYVRFDMSADHPVHRVVIEIDLPADDVREAYGTWAEVDVVSRDRCRLTMDADTFEWPTHIVTNLVAACTIVEPPEFREHVVSVAARAQASTAPVPSR